MLLDDEKKIYLSDEEGNEYEYEVLFTFESDEYQKSYVLYFDPTLPEDDIEVMFSAYDEDMLYIVDDEEEQAMIQEVFNTFMDEEEMQ